MNPKEVVKKLKEREDLKNLGKNPSPQLDLQNYLNKMSTKIKNIKNEDFLNILDILDKWGIKYNVRFLKNGIIDLFIKK